jgi:hydrogenase maturation protein HypF
VGVQHHHAHIVACMAENDLESESKVIGVAFDGTGYGDDGAIWGGEFLVSDHRSYQRVAHLKYVPLPGGDRAVREPWRMALAWLQSAGIAWEADLAPVKYAAEMTDQPFTALNAVRRQLQTGLNAPRTSSMGRLFDAAAALAGMRHKVNYEAQAAIEFEAMADGHETGYYLFDLKDGIIDAAPAFAKMVGDLRRGAGIPTVSARFHAGVAMMVRQVCSTLRQETGIKQVALSGGVWQNVFLLSRSVGLLQDAGFEVYLHRQVPANDGGLALGQAVVANACLKNR